MVRRAEVNIDMLDAITVEHEELRVAELVPLDRRALVGDECRIALFEDVFQVTRHGDAPVAPHCAAAFARRRTSSVKRFRRPSRSMRATSPIPSGKT